jgi:drug/metabolite transporter (DMT)-like permease
MLLVYLSLLFMILIWSMSFITVDIAIEYTPSLTIALYRFVVASLTFVLIDIYLKLKNKSEQPQNPIAVKKTKFSRKEWTLAIIASLTGNSLFFVAQYTAIELIGPSLPALFVCLLAPVAIAILSLIFFDEKMNSIKIIGFIIATIGGFLLITGGDIRNLTPASPNFVGYMAALITPLLWALYSTSMKQLSKTKPDSDLQILKYISHLGLVQIFIIVLVRGELLIFFINVPNIILLVCAMYLGIACYIVGYYIWQNAQKKMNSSNVASFLYIEPFLTLFFSFLLQRSEVIVLWNIIGGVIVLIAVLIINYK